MKQRDGQVTSSSVKSGQERGGVSGHGAGTSSIYVHGVALKGHDTVYKGIQRVYGVGQTHARALCREFSRSAKTTMEELAQSDLIPQIERWLTNNVVMESDRRRREADDIQRHRSLGTTRGIRMRLGRPVRGQRTCSNAKTAKRRNKSRTSLS
jgi:small subunit ribosomal protein S13